MKILFLQVTSSDLATKVLLGTVQSQKTQGFCVADFATLSDERKSRSKFFPLFIGMKEPCVRKFEGLARSKLLGISQTKYKGEDIFSTIPQLNTDKTGKFNCMLIKCTKITVSV